MAGLPASRASVSVGPPLNCKLLASPGLATLTRLKVSPPEERPPEPPVPIKLFALLAMRLPPPETAMSLAGANWPVPMEFSATIVL